MKSFFSAIALFALLVVSAPVSAQTTENATGVNAVNAYGLLAHFQSINVRYTCSLKGGGGVVVEYTDGNGVMHFSPVLLAACTNTASGNVHSMVFSGTEAVSLGNLNITVNAASFTVYGAACGRAGCEWFAEPGYNISITISPVESTNLPDGPAPMPGCGCGCMRCAPSLNKGSKTCPYRGQCAKKNS